MPFYLVRRMIVGVLMLTLALPAWTMHICRCARGEGESVAVALTQQTPVRPCCAKRLAAAAEKRNSSQPTIHARCCCSDVRWNQTTAKVTPVRPHSFEPDFATVLWHVDSSAVHTVLTTIAQSPEGLVRAGPTRSAMILNCRCQV